MNSKLVAILAVGLLAVLALGGWTQEVPAASQAPRTVTVTGEAEVRVVPDEVILTLGVETWDKDLGRAIARALVEAHGGQLWLESEERRGTTARFTLPVA
ncbi:MAG: SIMPL domain-containing protein [Anaerolineae bacterium]